MGGVALPVTLDGPQDGERVLLLHGFPEGPWVWRDVVARLTEAGLRSATVEQRGYAAQLRPDDVAAYRSRHLVADAVEVLDALGWPTAHVVGHDWGAFVAWHLAARQPDRVLTLTAASIPHPAAYEAAMRDDPRQQELAGYVRFFQDAPGKAVEVLLRDDAATLRAMFTGSGAGDDRLREGTAPLRDPAAMLAAVRWYVAAADDPDRVPADVDVPTTYVWGDRDRGVAPAAAEGCAAHVTADYRFVRLPGVSHWLPLQVPDVLAGEVLRRVRRVGQPRATDR